jgi:hypothetical protein
MPSRWSAGWSWWHPAAPIRAAPVNANERTACFALIAREIYTSVVGDARATTVV